MLSLSGLSEVNSNCPQAYWVGSSSLTLTADALTWWGSIASFKCWQTVLPHIVIWVESVRAHTEMFCKVLWNFKASYWTSPGSPSLFQSFFSSVWCRMNATYVHVMGWANTWLVAIIRFDSIDEFIVAFISLHHSCAEWPVQYGNKWKCRINSCSVLAPI